MSEFPAVVTHNYDPARGAFRNLCALPDAAAEAVLDEIRRSGRRTIKPDYLPRRRATEAWLAAESRRRLGATRLARPIYFFLGDFAEGKDASRPCAHVLDLAALPADALTFTYPDSMTSLAWATLDRHAAECRPHHGRVFTLDEIRTVVAQLGLPDRAAPRGEGYVEVQLWDDAPLQHLGAIAAVG